MLTSLWIYSNAAIVPSVYFFYPETAYRSLEEMDAIFHKTHSVFSVVKVAKNEPYRYDKSGNPLGKYAESDDTRQASQAEGKPDGSDTEKGAQQYERT